MTTSLTQPQKYRVQRLMERSREFSDLDILKGLWIGIQTHKSACGFFTHDQFKQGMTGEQIDKKLLELATQAVLRKKR